MRSSRIVPLICACVLGLVTFASAQKKPSAATASAPAQEVKAAITGTVSDEAGVGVGGAAVTVKNGAGLSSSVTTDGQGLFALTDLSAGSYAVTVALRGARIFQASVVLSPGQVLTLSVAGAPVAQPDATPATPPPSAAGSAGSAAPVAQAQSTPTSAAPADQTQTAAPAPVQSGLQQVLAPAPPPPLPPPPPGGNGGSSIAGAVTDQTGAVLVGASVKISNAAGAVQSGVSDEKGNYFVGGLPPGSYTITVTAQGFKAWVADQVGLAAGQSLPIDAALEPAGQTTEVTVEGQKVATVETENAQVSGTITEKEVLSLGLNGRVFAQLIALTPGVSNQTGQDEAKVGVTGSVKYSVNGGRVEYNTFEVDGSDVLNAGLNGAESTLVVYPSLDAIQEVKVLTSNYGAMYGRTASGTVIVTTKSGGDKWHGSAYEFLRNEAFNARNYFDQTASTPVYRRNDFGFTLGGPFTIPKVYNPKKNKTYVFASEEFRLEKSPSDQHPNFNHGVPSLAERHGDFSDVCPLSAADAAPAFLRSQFPDCPATGPDTSDFTKVVGFPGNQISGPFGSLDSNALALLSTNLIPLPNSSGGCNSTIGSCYNAVISEPTYWREELFRLDQNITSKLRGTFRYIHDSWDTTVPVPQWSFLHQSNFQDSFPTVQNRFVGPGTSLVAELTQTLSPTLLNQFTASYSNSNITLTSVNGPGGANFQRPVGLGTAGGTCTTVNGFSNCPMGSLFDNGFAGKAPGIVIGGNNLEYGGSGFAVDPSYQPWNHTNPIFSYRDDLSKVLGKHTLQLGFLLVFAEKNEKNGPIGAATGDLQGLLTFNNINGGATNTGNAFANFLAFSFSGTGLNAIQSYSQDSAQRTYYNRYRIGEPYVQDDWKVTSHLTLNLGVRFSLFGVYHEKYLRAYNFDPSAYDPALAAQLRVDPISGQLISRPQHTSQSTPIPINLANPDPRILNGLVQCGVNTIPAGCMNGHVFNPAPRIGFAWDPRGDGKTSIRAGYGMFFEHGTGNEANTGSLEASAPLVLSMTQRFPQSYGCIGGSAGAAGFCKVEPGAYPISITAIPTRAVWPYAQQWSLSVQRELPKSMVATIGYVGSKGTHLTVERQLNQLKPLPTDLNPFGLHEPILPQVPSGSSLGDCAGFNTNGGEPVNTFHLRNGTGVGPQNPAFVNLEAACAGANSVSFQQTPNVNTLRPYPGFDQIFSLQNVADSSYHGLQATIRRVKGPLTAGISYTYSHSFDDASDRSDSTLVNSFDLRTNRASSNFDQRHLLSVSYIYELPTSHLWPKIVRWSQTSNPDGSSASDTIPLPDSTSRLGHMLMDGWEISGITIFQSGTPFSVVNGGSGAVSVLDNAGVANGIGAGSYPDLVGDPHGPPPLGGNNARSFGPLLGNPDAFAAPRGLTFGNAGRNAFNNPGRVNFDISVLKHLTISESGVLEFRAEAFNIFNHTQFRIYNSDLGNTGSNVISCYGGPNYTAGFSAPGGTDCLTGSAFLHPVDAHRARTLQLGLKLKF